MVEHLAQSTDQRIRVADLVRDLGLTQATAHAIVSTLCERGWLVRDAADKTLIIGPALGVAAARAESARPWTSAAKAAAARLAANLDCTMSVSEQIGTSLLVTALAEPHQAQDLGGPGQQVPYAPPFGSSFAAWEDTDGRMTWINRGGTIGPDLTQRLVAILDATRDRGYSVERMTPLVNQAPALIVALHSHDPRSPLRTHIQGLIAEITTVGLPTPDEQDRPSDQPVTTVAAPVFDNRGRVVVNLSAHPLRALSATRVRELGRRLVVEARAISPR